MSDKTDFPVRSLTQIAYAKERLPFVRTAANVGIEHIPPDALSDGLRLGGCLPRAFGAPEDILGKMIPRAWFRHSSLEEHLENMVDLVGVFGTATA